MNGFEHVDIQPRTMLDKILGRRKHEVARVHVQNVLASQPIFQVYHDGVVAILRGYGLTTEDAKPWLTEIYQSVLKFHLAQGKLAPKDEQAIERLGELFGFSHEYMAELNAPLLGTKANAGAKA